MRRKWVVFLGFWTLFIVFMIVGQSAARTVDLSINVVYSISVLGLTVWFVANVLRNRKDPRKRDASMWAGSYPGWFARFAFDESKKKRKEPR